MNNLTDLAGRFWTAYSSFVTHRLCSSMLVPQIRALKFWGILSILGMAVTSSWAARDLRVVGFETRFISQDPTYTGSDPRWGDTLLLIVTATNDGPDITPVSSVNVGVRVVQNLQSYINTPQIIQGTAQTDCSGAPDFCKIQQMFKGDTVKISFQFSPPGMGYADFIGYINANGSHLADDPNASNDSSDSLTGGVPSRFNVLPPPPAVARSQTLHTRYKQSIAVTLDGDLYRGLPWVASLGASPAHGTAVPAVPDPVFGPGYFAGVPTWDSVANPLHAIFSPKIIYTPQDGFSGTDSFTWFAGIPAVGIANSQGTITIIVDPPNPPTANPQSHVMLSNTVAHPTFWDMTLTGSDPNVPALPLDFEIVAAPTHGGITGTGANRRYTPAQNYHGPDSFTFRAKNGYVNSAPVAVTITVQNRPPTITSLLANPNPVASGNMTQLQIIADDEDDGETGLLYGWTVTGPAPVDLSDAGPSHPAKNAAATFHKKGSYQFTATVQDPFGGSVQEFLTVTVQSDPAGGHISVLPTAATVARHGNQPFAATAYDQFGDPLDVQPVFNWFVSGGGVMDAAVPGLFHAGGVAGGPHTVTAAVPGMPSGAAQVTISPNIPPQIDQAFADPNPVTTGNITTLHVVAHDNDDAESTLVYTWTTTDPNVDIAPIAPDHSAVATFHKIGVYSFTVTVQDPAGDIDTRVVSVTVQPDVAGGSIEVIPPAVTLHPRGTQQFTATAKDQFGDPLAPQPASFVWAVPAAAGTIDATGRFTAGNTPGGPFDVTAQANGVTGHAQVTIGPDSPPVIDQAFADPNPVVTGNVTTLHVVAHDDDDTDDRLTYLWTNTSGPAAVDLGTPAANHNVVATFHKIGTYDFRIVVQDPAGNSDSRTVVVTVQADAAGGSIEVVPSAVTLHPRGIQQFTATAKDQFGDPLAPQPASFVWAVPAAAGTIDATGRFTAGNTPGGPFDVTAQANGVTGHAQVTIGPDSPPVIDQAFADPNPVTSGNSTTLHVVAHDDDDTDDRLTYLWTNTAGPAPVDLGAPAANHNVVATFHKIGTYDFRIVVQDPAGGSDSRLVSVVVQPDAAGGTIEIVPSAVTLHPRGIQQFTATAKDQFGDPLAPQPASFVWAVPAAAGTIDATGRFTAGNTPGGPFDVTAQANGVTGHAQVTIGPDSPPVIDQAFADPNPVVTGNVTTLHVVAHDDDDTDDRLTYLWTNTSGPAAVDLGTPAANHNVVATFHKIGTYGFRIIVRDPAGHSDSRDISVDVLLDLSGGRIVVTPPTAIVQINQTQQFNATAYDQFNDELVPQPVFAWSVSGGGVMDAGTPGLFRAGAVAGGPFTVTAAAGALPAGTAQVTVSITPAPPARFIARIELTPREKVIQLGDSQALTAIAYDNFGTRVNGITFEWHLAGARGGAISNAGLFSTVDQFATPRQYIVTASSLQVVSNEARITVLVPSSGSGDICNAIAYPVPYKSTEGLPGITFGHLAPSTKIRIFSADGRIVRSLRSENGEDVLWDVRNEEHEKVASWVYYYILEQSGPCPDRKGKLIVIQ